MPLAQAQRDINVIQDWTAVAQKAVGESAVIDITGGASIKIQAFLDSTTAHVGTEFKVQISGNSSGDEDWQDYGGAGSFIALSGTANSENITNNPLAAASTTITVASTTGYVTDDVVLPWRAIEDATLAHSELILQTGYTTDTSITIQDGTTNAHVQNTPMYNIAISKPIYIPPEQGRRARVIVNNNYDSNGSSLNYRVTV